MKIVLNIMSLMSTCMSKSKQLLNFRNIHLTGWFHSEFTSDFETILASFLAQFFLEAERLKRAKDTCRFDNVIY